MLRYTDGHLMAIANWKNQTIWTGDNLDIMRGMNSESVDLIYLDPPFNSNRTYSAPIGSEAAGAAFKDTWALDDVDIAWIGLIAEKEPCLPHVIDTAGIAHGKGMKSYLVMMAVRLLEMRRLLKPTGSVYLHCDPTASHYLKLVMDCVFGSGNFRNEIQWRRYGAHNDVGQGSRHFGRVHDKLLLYGKGPEPTWNQVFAPLDRQYVESTYRYVEPETGRRFATTPMTGPGGVAKGNPEYEWNGHTRSWRYSRDTMQKLHDQGRLYYSKTGYARKKLYLDESRGVPVQDIWNDIRSLSGAHKERLGYPTQKPLELLNRIIEASSNEGDTVLDPFCGCATACVAAHALSRKWTGIDISSKAAELMVHRLKQDRIGQQADLTTQAVKVIHRTDIPLRTDTGPLPPYKTHRHTLYGLQEGKCAGCGHHFPFQNFTVDHIIAKSKGGTDHIENLQLLCNHCNSVKGTMDQAAFVAKLKASGLGA
ncbi:MAG: hypothetical protein F4X77_00405 [Acidobacteriia bacterium]|nr:hypothetical protein [Terriglobia bacterium]